MQCTDERIIETDNGTRATPLVVLRILLSGGVLAAALGSQPLLDWTERLSDNQVSTVVITITRAWHAAMLHIGATIPYEFIHTRVHLFETKQF
jgi:hypothetical protein